MNKNKQKIKQYNINLNLFGPYLLEILSPTIRKNKKTKYKICFKKNLNELDQFYTNEVIAKACFSLLKSVVDVDKFDFQIEPSAGTGSFFNLMTDGKKYGIDLEPKGKGIVRKDFFDYHTSNKNIITIGNPPFGKNASMAVKFFNHAATFSKVIAFIVPKTFKKNSIKNRLNLNFHLLLEEDLPKNSFILNDKAYNVPCCFQVWKFSEIQRKKKIFSLENDYFKFVDKENADLAVRRVGGTTGKAKKNIKDCATVSHYFIKIINKSISKYELFTIINSINFSKIINSTAGVKSLSKQEFIQEFNYYMKNKYVK